MKQNRIFLIIGIVLFILGSYAINKYDDSYYTPEDAARNYQNLDNKYIYNNMIETVHEEDTAVVFYLSKNDALCDLVTKKNAIGWKASNFMGFSAYTNLKKYTSENLQNNASYIRINPTKQLVYGYTSSPEINNTKVNGIKPTIKEFDVDGIKFKLWYVIGDINPQNINIKTIDKNDNT